MQAHFSERSILTSKNFLLTYNALKSKIALRKIIKVGVQIQDRMKALALAPKYTCFIREIGDIYE